MSERNCDKRILLRMVRIGKLPWVLPRHPRHSGDLKFGAGEAMYGLSASILPDLHGAWIELSFQRPKNVSEWLQSCVMYKWTCWDFGQRYTGRDMPPSGRPIWYRLASKPEPILEEW